MFCYKAKTNDNAKEKTKMPDTSLFANERISSTINLKTFYVQIRNNGFEYIVRAILDTGFSKYYISKFIANKMELKSLRKFKITHAFLVVTETTMDLNLYSIDLGI